MDGAREYNAKWNKSEKDKYQVIPYVEFKKQNNEHRGREGKIKQDESREREKP